jgi:hypothetical protein
VISTARVHYPELPVWVLTADTIEHRWPSAKVVSVAEVTSDLGLMVTETLDGPQQLAFALPFLLDRLLAEVGPLLYVSPGCLFLDTVTELEDALADFPVVLAGMSTPREAHTQTPNLGELTAGRGQLSHRVLALRPEGAGVLDRWRSAMTETFFDVAQRLPTDFTASVFAAMAAEPMAAVVGERSLMKWTDYAALQSERSIGPNPGLVVADDLWDLGRRQADESGDAEVEWQLLVDKVHDSRPLAALVEVVKASVAASPNTADADLPFVAFAREARRATDPTGARWGVGDHELFLDWLFERNTRGTTRAADLYLAGRPDICQTHPGIRRDPEILRRWNERAAFAEIGMDLLDRDAEPRPVEHEVPGPPNTVQKLRWRLQAAKTMVPGHGTWQARNEEAYPRRRGAPQPPKRVAPTHLPAHYGTAPRGLNMIGCFRSESGLGQAARASLAAVRHLGHPFSYIDTSEEYPSRYSVEVGLADDMFGA